MARKPLRAAQIKSGKDVYKALDRSPIQTDTREAKGSHRLTIPLEGDKKDEAITWYDHGEFPPGMRSALVKRLLAAGIIVPILISLIYLAL